MSVNINQITDYPKGTRIEAVRAVSCHVGVIPTGTKGTITSHTDDGRAWVFFDGYDAGHTFQEPERFIRVVCTHGDENCPANHEPLRPTGTREIRADTSEFDQVFEQLEVPEYPATCDECGEVGTNASMEGHECAEGYDIEQGRVAFQKELTDAMVRAGAREVELSGPRAAERKGCTCSIQHGKPHERTEYCDDQEDWSYIKTQYGAEVQAGQFTLRAHWIGLAEPEVIRAMMQRIVIEHNQHATLVEQRDRALVALNGIKECAFGIMPSHRDMNHLRQIVIEANDARWTRLYAILAEAQAALTTIEQSARNADEGDHAD